MPGNDPYFIEAVSKAIDVLELFDDHNELRIVDVSARVGMTKSTAYRFLYTLEKKGLIERTHDAPGFRKKRRHRIGFVSISATVPFVAEVERGILNEARKIGIDVDLRHHEFDGRRMIDEVESLLAQGVSLMLCYNPDEHIAHVVADRCAQAGVPVVAITFPVPGARVFGVNNYRAGMAGGEGLGEHIARRWSGKVDRVVILDIPGDSPAQNARIRGMLEGVRKHVSVDDENVLHLHTKRQQVTAEAAMRDVLLKNRKASRFAVLCYNDVNALGALTAVEAADRSDEVMILSQGAVAEVRTELMKRNSALWGAVAHFPERFGEKLIPLVLRAIRGESIPQATYTEHVLLTATNVRKYYEQAMHA